MKLLAPSLDWENSQYMAILLAIIGIAMLYFWSMELGYEKISIAQIGISEKGKAVEFEGKVEEIRDKKEGNSISVCSELQDCVSVYVRDDAEGDWVADDPVYSEGEVKVLGEVEELYGNRFVRAHKVNVIR
ncbi:MAG: hypothetical protein ABIH83_04950 [Candidatus Micrarchaeota archaeon]